MDVNQFFPWFSLTEKVPSSMNEGRRLTRTILNDDGVFNFISLIKMKDYIVKTITEILSIVKEKVFRLFIYLIV